MWASLLRNKQSATPIYTCLYPCMNPDTSPQKVKGLSCPKLNDWLYPMTLKNTFCPTLAQPLSGVVSKCVG